MIFFVIDVFYRDGPIASCVCVCGGGGGGGGGVRVRSMVHILVSIPYGNLIQGVCVFGV